MLVCLFHGPHEAAKQASASNPTGLLLYDLPQSTVQYCTRPSISFMLVQVDSTHDDSGGAGQGRAGQGGAGRRGEVGGIR